MRTVLVWIGPLAVAACGGTSMNVNPTNEPSSAGEGGKAAAGEGSGGSGGRGGNVGIGASGESSGGSSGEASSGDAGEAGEAGEAGTGTAGTGNAGAAGSAGGAGGAPPLPPTLSSCGDVLTVYLRDFQPETHPDFEPQDPDIDGHVPGKTDVAETGIVASTVDENWKPIYAGNATSGTNSTTGKANFDKWFFDVPGTNLGVEYDLQFADPEGDGVFTFDRSGASVNQFFPLDDGETCPAEPTTPCLLGNWPRYPSHNFHMTMELHTAFVYQAGQTFTFYGDDDAWAFVNGQLVLDLGGIHEPQEKLVSLSAIATQIGLVVAEAYRLDFFWAERKVVNSNFRIETNIEFADCGLPPVIR